MLVLSRKLQQQIKIGDQITVTILRVKGNTVRIGVQAPRDVRVIRGELPKVDGAMESNSTIPAEAVITIAEGEIIEAAEASEEVKNQPSSQFQPAHSPTPLAAAHLPLRRLRHRYGRGPLQQVIATSAALAK